MGCDLLGNLIFIVFFFVSGDMVIATLGVCKWQLYWKTKATILQLCIAGPKLDLVYYGLPGLTSILGVQLHGNRSHLQEA